MSDSSADLSSATSDEDVVDFGKLLRWGQMKMSAFRRGQKATFVTEASEKLCESVENARNLMFQIISSNRPPSSVQNISKGVWCSERKIVKISRPRGKYFQTMGKQVNSFIEILPEEALFLVGKYAMELSVDEEATQACSLQAAYSLLLQPSTSLSFDDYLVYCHLKRLGYIVLPYSSQLQIATTEEVSPNIQLTSNSLISDYYSQLNIFTCREQSTDLGAIIQYDVYRPNPKFKKTNPGVPDFQIAIFSFSSNLFPNLLTIQSLLRHRNIPLKIALVNYGTVSFYSLSSLSLPNIHENFVSSNIAGENFHLSAAGSKRRRAS